MEIDYMKSVYMSTFTKTTGKNAYSTLITRIKQLSKDKLLGRDFWRR